MPTDPKPLETMADVREALYRLLMETALPMPIQYVSTEQHQAHRLRNGVVEIYGALSRIRDDAVTCEGCNTIRLGADLFTLDDGCRFCRECIDRALAAIPAEPESGWRPIEAAPMDGTRVILGRPGWRETGYWSVLDKCWRSDPSLERVEPTHYQLLPTPPQPQDYTDAK